MGRKHILAVNGSPDFLDFLCELLQEEQFNPSHPVHDGAQSLTPDAPGLSPAERVFAELRRAVEGLVYTDIDQKVAAVEALLTDLAADPDRVRRLVGWRWITQSLASLPAHS